MDRSFWTCLAAFGTCASLAMAQTAPPPEQDEHPRCFKTAVTTARSLLKDGPAEVESALLRVMVTSGPADYVLVSTSHPLERGAVIGEPEFRDKCRIVAGRQTLSFGLLLRKFEDVVFLGPVTTQTVDMKQVDLKRGEEFEARVEIDIDSKKMRSLLGQRVPAGTEIGKMSIKLTHLPSGNEHSSVVAPLKLR